MKNSILGEWKVFPTCVTLSQLLLSLIAGFYNSTSHSICSNLFAPPTRLSQSTGNTLCPVGKSSFQSNHKGQAVIRLCLLMVFIDVAHISFNFDRDHQVTKQTNKRKGE